MNEYKVMVVGRAMACPMACARWLRANRVKSGMFKDTVAQKPTTPFSAGTRNLRKSGKLVKRDGAESMGPNPPALVYAHASRSRPTATRMGALSPCRKRMYSIPFRITNRLINQNAMKQIPAPCGTDFQNGHTV